MPVKKGTRKLERPYDAERKEETLTKLNSGLNQLKRQKKYKEGQRISIYALHNKTGVTEKTIKKYIEKHEEIRNAFEAQTKPKGKFMAFTKVTKFDPQGIKNLPQAIIMIETLVEIYNKVVDRYDEGVKQNSALNLEIAKLKDDNLDLKRKLQRSRVQGQ